MKNICLLLIISSGLSAARGGSAAIFIGRSHARYGSSVQPLEIGRTKSSEHGYPNLPYIISRGISHQEGLVRRRDLGMTARPHRLGLERSSFLNLQSEQQEVSSTEGERATSAAESYEKNKSVASENQAQRSEQTKDGGTSEESNEEEETKDSDIVKSSESEMSKGVEAENEHSAAESAAKSHAQTEKEENNSAAASETATHQLETDKQRTHVQVPNKPATHGQVTHHQRAHESAAHEPIAHELADKEAAVHESAASESVAHKPTANKRAAHPPAAHEPEGHEPARREPEDHDSAIAQEPATHEAANNKRVTHKHATHPTVHQPGASDPADHQLANEDSAQHREKAESLKLGYGEDDGSTETEFEHIIGRLRILLKAARGKELFGRLMTIIDLHEKAEQAEKELKKQETTEEAKTGQLKEDVTDVNVQQDLLLSQQLTNMWVLPIHEEGKRETCLSGFERLTHEATITCADPECFKLETQAQKCPYMSIASIMRKEGVNAQKGLPADKGRSETESAKDHMLLGFNGECQSPENLGTEILSLLQRPKHLAKKHALERSTGTGGTAPRHKHQLDLICDPDVKAEYPACKTIYEALQHFTKPDPRTLPELLILTDIKDLKNTLGLYRITFLFEGIVQFAAPDGTKIDASKHKLPTEEADFMYRHRHDNLTHIVMAKED